MKQFAARPELVEYLGANTDEPGVAIVRFGNLSADDQRGDHMVEAWPVGGRLCSVALASSIVATAQKLAPSSDV